MSALNRGSLSCGELTLGGLYRPHGGFVAYNSVTKQIDRLFENDLMLVVSIERLGSKNLTGIEVPVPVYRYTWLTTNGIILHDLLGNDRFTWTQRFLQA